MTPPTGILLGAAAVLLVLAGALAAFEAALPRLGRTRVRQLADERRGGAGALARLVTDPPRALAVATLLRITAETVAVVAVTLVVATRWLGQWWQVLLVAGLGLALVSFVAVGAGPRALGLRHSEPVALIGAPVMSGLVGVLGTPASGLAWLASTVTGRGQAPAAFGSEAQLRDLLEQAEESAVIDREENRMVQRVLTLGSLSAREVMVPRTDMVTVGRGVDLFDAMDLFLKSGFSRLPVVGADPDDVVGVCYVKDVAAKLHPHADAWSGPRTQVGALAVADVMRPVLFVPESKPADDLLRELQKASVHLAVVVDEYGGVAGLATIEDLLEEIVGSISDEYDQEAPEAEVLGEDRWRVSARMHLHSLGELVEVELDEVDVDTVGGLLAKELGQVPLPGSSADVQGLRITADTRDGRRNRLRTVVVERVRAEEGEDDAPAGATRAPLPDEPRVPEGAHA